MLKLKRVLSCLLVLNYFIPDGILPHKAEPNDYLSAGHIQSDR